MNKLKVKQLLLLLGVTFSVSLSRVPHETDTLSRGVVIDSVFCEAHPGQSYALYLPSYYSIAKKWPVVFIFEPAARGKMAVDTFLQAGERFGVIIMCSNNSSNRSYESSLEAAEAMYHEARVKFPVDSSGIFVAGFSGGSRVASNLAIQNPAIKGVIACGAGMYHNKKTHPDLPRTFFYYGIIGRRDMNLPDMLETAERLSAQNIEHHIQYNEIVHVWPHSVEITAAMAWLRFRTDDTDSDAKEYYLGFQESESESLVKKGHILDAAERLESVIIDFPDPDFVERQSILKEDKLYGKQLRSRKRAYSMGSKLQESYLKALTDFVYTTPVRPDTIHTVQWWNNEIDRLNHWEKSRQIENSRMASRLLYLLEVHFNEDISVYLSKFQLEKALFLADLWMRVGPDQLWSLWNIAEVYTLAGNHKQAINIIENMLQFKNAKVEWILDAPEFESLRTDPEFKRITEEFRETIF